MKKLEKWLVPFGSKLAGNSILSAIRDGIAVVIPLVMAGSIALIIKNFPITSWTNWLAKDGLGFSNFLLQLYYGSFALMALVAVFGIAYAYAKRKNVDPLAAGIISLASYVITLPFSTTIATTAIKSQSTNAKGVTNIVASATGQGIDFTLLGSQGLFGAILVGLISAVIFTWFVTHKITIKMPETVPPAVANSFTALIPGVVILLFWDLIQAGLAATPMHSLNNMMTVILGQPLTVFGSSIWGVVIIVALNSILWFVGVHGGNITFAIMDPIYLALMAQNLQAYEAHKAIPNIVSRPFMDNFIYLGGGGATLGLVIALTLFAKSRQYKTLKPLVMVPGIFNINEPTMFGVPVVLNVYLIIPFIVTPIVNALISYSAMAIGLVARTTGVALPWTLPPIVSGFLATSSWTGAALQAVLIVLDILIWFPFLKISDNRELALENGEVKEA
ncbi:MAG: PTS transporter subunit EIIC [Lactobacillaceae bacterium]|nr:PTS transporter subunit EIIC [Lactobacillaceae bacterium]